MAKENETIADIIAEKRLRAAEMEKTLGDQHSLVESLKDDADRLEAAHKREIETKDSVIQTLSAARDDELDRHRREVDALKRRRSELDAEVAAKDEVIQRLDDAIAEEQRRKMATAENSSAVGNCAKLREALMRIQNLAEIHIQDLAEALDPDDPNVIAILDTCRAALAAPPRNCDKYENDNAIEQFEREILGKEAATTYERLFNMRENWFRYNSWLFEKAKERRGDESPRTGQEGK